MWGNGDFRSPALVIETADGTRGADFRYRSHEIREGKYALPGLPAAYLPEGSEEEAETLEVILEEDLLGLELRLLYGIFPEHDVITRAVRIRNRSGEEVWIDKLLPASLDFTGGAYDCLVFHGRHTMERMVERIPVGHASIGIGSRRGASSHQHNPVMILAGRGTTDDCGDCYALVFVYSGGFQGSAETDQYGTCRVQLGLQEEGFRYPLKKGEEFVSPEVILSYSKEGTDRLSHNLHGLIREHICRWQAQDGRRPVVVNSWEASYFAITKESLLSLAKEAAAIGADMLVVDDGWFGNRKDDLRALGDWYTNEDKLGGSLAQLAEEVNRIGLGFGIWMEPEMVSEDSDLYRSHPDWALQIPGRAPVRGRYQLVLDLSREDVRKEIFRQICAVLDSAPIEYLKWDFNRSIFEACSTQAGHQGRVLYDYVRGLYEVLEKLHLRYPHLLIEGCSGGGGRFDAGMLYYTPQIWTSDNTDPIDRLRIQYGTSFAYPVSAMAAHVSKSPNEQTGRVTPLDVRGLTAMYGAFGYEMDLSRLSDEEKQEAREQIRQYHRFEDLITAGLYYRLSDPARDPYVGWAFVRQDGSEALVHVVQQTAQANGPADYVRLKGLLPEGLYREEGSGQCFDAALLMAAGFPLPATDGAYRAHAYHFVLEEKTVP